MRFPSRLKPELESKHPEKSQGPKALYEIGLQAGKKRDFKPNDKYLRAEINVT